MSLLRILFCLTALFVSAFPAGAAPRSVALLEFDDVAISSSSGKPLSNEQVRSAIIKGGAAHNWVASAPAGNAVKLTYSRREFSATVQVTYNSKSYSIKYADSTNLHYASEGGKAVIHPNYNKWMNSLRQSIDVALRSY